MTDQEFVKLHYPNARVDKGIGNFLHILNGDKILGSSWTEENAWEIAKSHIESPNGENTILRLQVLTSRVDELVKRVEGLERGPPTPKQKKSDRPTLKNF